MNKEQPPKVRIEYVRGNLFRVVHVDGAFGGTTPRLQLFIDFYSERFPIPRVLVYEASPEGAPLREIVEERESEEGIVRESEVGLVLDLPVAKVFSEWLNEKVAELERVRENLGSPAQEKDLK